MFCCSITWFIATVLCAFFVPLILLLFLTGHIALLPEVTKLLLVAWWCYIEALFNWIAPRKRKSIEGLTAVVTGGGHGIGREIALGLAKKGETCISETQARYPSLPSEVQLPVGVFDDSATVCHVPNQ